jgi:alpha 1,2-mannosyltransferase
VVCAGGASLLAQAYTTLDVLRGLHGCRLPVELFFAGPDEMSRKCQRFFETRFEPLACVDATAAPTRPLHAETGNLCGYPLKAHAFLNTSFDELLSLDADSAPLRDPTTLFESPPHREHGNVFWPDTSMISTAVYHANRRRIYSFRDEQNRSTVQSLNPRIFDYLELPRPCTPQRASYETESGQLLIDRRICFRAVQLAWFINSRSRFFYRYMHGDKDTYRLAFALAGQSFCQLQHQSHQAGVVREGRFLGKAVIQRDHEGHPAFLHQTHRKPDLKGPWLPLTHVVEDPPLDHPRPRAQRDVSMSADLKRLSKIQSVDAEVRQVDEFIRASRESLSSDLESADLPLPPRKRWLRRRILPW